jgi:murein DD-endopeptidase MepM/ murein hydrolase activator NlpD
MSENQPNNNKSLSQKVKDAKVNRSAVITFAALVMALVVIIAISLLSNRAKKNELPPSVTTYPSATGTRPSETTTKAPESTKAPASTTGSAPVEDKLPSFILPVNGILSKSHDATLQVYSNTMKDYRVHLGVDIVTEENAPVYAAADGKVSKIWKDTLMGYSIAIKHSGDCYTVYKNLSEILPEGIVEGATVRSGQLIGSVGDSAMVEVAEEPHLHFEMTVADLMVDPLEYFDDRALETLKIDASHGE